MRLSLRSGPSPAPRARRLAPPALVALALAWVVILTVDPWADERVSDLFLYRSMASAMLDGYLPYRDFSFEYPPLAAAVIALPGVVGTGEDGYRLAFAGLSLLLAVAVLLLTGRLAEQTGGDRGRAMLAVALAPLLTGAMIRTHFDLAPVVLTLAALVALSSDRARLGFVLLGVGVATKGFPLVVAPVALTWLWVQGKRREAVDGALALAVTVAVIAGGAVALSASGAVDTVQYHLERPVQIESPPAMVLLGLDALGAGEATSVHSHRSDGLEHPAADALSAVFSGLMVASVALLCVGLAGRTLGRIPTQRPTSCLAPGAASNRMLVLAALTAVAAFATLGKVLSPQFLIWVVPLGALALAWREYPLALLTAVATLLTLIEFPARYFDVVAREPFPIALVAARDLALLAVVAVGAICVGAATRALRSAAGDAPHLT